MYTLTPIESNASNYFKVDQANFHILKAHSNIGFQVPLFRKLALRFEVGASINYFQKVEENSFSVNYDSIADLYFNYHTLIGIDLSWLVLELSHEFGFTDAFKTESDSRFRGVRLSTGFFF